jgi:hypothetical protein
MLNYLSLAGDQVSVMCPDDTANPPKDYKGYAPWLVALTPCPPLVAHIVTSFEVLGGTEHLFRRRLDEGAHAKYFVKKTASTFSLHVHFSFLFFSAEFDVCIFFA